MKRQLQRASGFGVEDCLSQDSGFAAASPSALVIATMLTTTAQNAAKLCTTSARVDSFAWYESD